MSLKAWQLELCNSSSTTTTTIPPTSAPSTASAPSPTDLQSYRIPPRSSLAQQLRRLNSLLPDAPRIGADLNLIKDNGVVLSRTNDRDPDDDGSVASTSTSASDADGVLRKTRPPHPSLPRCPATARFVPDLPRGPFEPLLLSLPGDPHVVQVPPTINCRLLEHQREGVKFLYNLYWRNIGGILGDDMGLGKTIQTIAFLAAIIGKDSEKEDQHNNSIVYFHRQGPALIVCPTSVIQNWAKEFSEWGEFSFSIYHGPNCDLVIEKLTAKSIDIIITSYDTFRIHAKILCDIQWDVVIVDEAHRLKNEKSRLYEACLGFKTRRRYGLTGTIVQNKILELFNLFDWVAPGSLGTREHFREFYDEPLKHGQRLSAPKRFVQIADERKKHLSSLLGKYLLRRTKEETIGHLMFGKEDNVVFCAMSNLQKRAYRRMLDQPEIQCLINKDLPCACGSPLKQVECCKRVVPNGILWSYLHRDNPDGCDSCPFCLVLPCIIKLQQISNHLELIKPNPKDEPEKQKKDAEFASAILGTDVSLLGGNMQSENFMELSNAEHCGKMRALEKLTSIWVSESDKILLFSYSVRMMDILEKFLVRKGYGFSRLDGSTPMCLRQSLVDEFNKSPSKQIFLVSTRAGGLGLNLVSANRVVIFDPNWNPAHDLQAQDRSFRYGQKRRVVVFRLLAAGSVEELVYSRQIYKQQLSNIAVSGKMEKRYFEGVQDCKEFQGELFGICNLFRDLSDKLFTSEIFEVNENQLRESSGSTDKKDAYNTASGSASDVDGKPRFDNLGIIYSHRNDEVVNMAPNPPGKDDAQILCPSDSVKPVKRKSATVGLRGRSGALCDEQKRKEYTVLAQSMGMDELKFSKWVLSASVTELEKLLDNHRLPRSKACAMSDCAG